MPPRGGSRSATWPTTAPRPSPGSGRSRAISPATPSRAHRSGRGPSASSGWGTSVAGSRGSRTRASARGHSTGSRSSRADEPGIHRVELAELLRRSDIVSLHVQHSPETEGLIDGAALSSMRPDAIMIDTAPMEIVSIPALERRLATTELTFIADHADELAPADAARLARHPNCLLYPPVAYRTRELRRQGGRLRVGAGERPRSRAQ